MRLKTPRRKGSTMERKNKKQSFMKSAGDLIPYKDTLYIYMGVDKGGWRIQLSVLNCNKPKIWKMLTESPSCTFHYLERSTTKEKFIYDGEKFVDFSPEIHTPNW